MCHPRGWKMIRPKNICVSVKNYKYQVYVKTFIKLFKTYFPPILAWVRLAWQKLFTKLLTLVFVFVSWLEMAKKFPRILKTRFFLNKDLLSNDETKIYGPTQRQSQHNGPEGKSITIHHHHHRRHLGFMYISDVSFFWSMSQSSLRPRHILPLTVFLG